MLICVLSKAYFIHKSVWIMWIITLLKAYSSMTSYTVQYWLLVFRHRIGTKIGYRVSGTFRQFSRSYFGYFVYWFYLQSCSNFTYFHAVWKTKYPLQYQFPFRMLAQIHATFLQIPLALIIVFAINRTPLVLAISFPLLGWIRNFHPLEMCAARRT